MAWITAGPCGRSTTIISKSRPPGSGPRTSSEWGRRRSLPRRRIAQRMLDLPSSTPCRNADRRMSPLGIVVQNLTATARTRRVLTSTPSLDPRQQQGTHLTGECAARQAERTAWLSGDLQPLAGRRPSTGCGRPAPHAGRGRRSLPGEHEDRAPCHPQWCASRGSAWHPRCVPRGARRRGCVDRRLPAVPGRHRGGDPAPELGCSADAMSCGGWAPLLVAVIEKRDRKRRDGKAYSVYRVRWYEADGRERSRTFDSRADAKAFEGRSGRSSAPAGSRSSMPAPRHSPSSRRSGGSCMRSRTSSGRRSRTTERVQQAPADADRHTRLRDLSVPTLVRLRADLEADGVGAGPRKSLAVLQSILQRAVEWERIGSNPAGSVPKPPMRRDRAITPLTPETVERIRATLLDQGRVRDATLVSVLAYAGVRPQEAVALRWRHVRRTRR